MSKKTRCRVLSLLLALVMVLGMVPMASASSAYNVKLTPTTPDASKLSAEEHRRRYAERCRSRVEDPHGAAQPH